MPATDVRIAALACILFVMLDALVFATPLYRSLLAPDSTTGSFERAIARVDADGRGPARDVLVLGDSRIFSGLDAARADAFAGGSHVVNAGVPGTTPRCWTVFDRLVDPQAHRYRAVVIPVDTYADDDGAIGSIDADDRRFDLRYVGLRANLGESLAIAASFSSPSERIDAFLELGLRGPLVRDDVQAFARDPLARMRALRDAPPFDVPASRRESLAGLRVDFAHDRVVVPASATPEQRRDLERQLFLRPAPSARYARYRREWLGPLVARYAKAGVPVIFVRIPTRPAHRGAPPRPSGTLLVFAHTTGARLLPQEPYVALERPELFADADHLDAAGAARFSAQLGRDLARVLRDPAFGRIDARSAAARDDATTSAAPSPRAIVRATLRGLEIGTPLAFQSFAFAIFFVAVALLCYAAREPVARKVVLLIASWYVYARWNAWYLAVLVALTATDYAFGRAIAAASDIGARRRARVLLTLGIAANLAFLGTAKYADFFTATFAAALGMRSDPWALHVLVPVGISFHTFQSISYLVDVSRGKARVVRDPLDYALYLAFFPQLLAGPIVRASRFFGELWAWRAPAAETIVRGLGEIAIGLLKKSAVADRFAPFADAYFAAPAAHPGAPAAWCATLAFALQIYFDFSGYSDIAIGSARVLGFDFPPNFRRPYLAWSITEFWRRWHMTLSAWLRDYVYIPLGGNRAGRIATLRNLMLTMLLGGLWHGANWTFVAWGGYHGALLVLERVAGIGRARDGAPPRPAVRLPATLATFALVAVGWVLFRATTFGDAATIVRALVLGGPGGVPFDRGDVAIAVVALAAEIVLEFRGGFVAGIVAGGPRIPRIVLLDRRVRGASRLATAVALLFGLELATFTGEAAPFVYFKF